MLPLYKRNKNNYNNSIHYRKDGERMRKYSRKREAILQAIYSSKSHPAAETVYNELKPMFPDLSLGTVYRNISLFKDLGEVVSVGVVNGHERFDGKLEPHPHFICDGCGRVDDIETSFDVSKMDADVETELNCLVTQHNLVFHGLCAACAEERRK